VNLTLALRDLVVLRCSSDDDNIYGGYEGIKALNYWKDIVNAKAPVVRFFLII
jgi:hypothetical protein